MRGSPARSSMCEVELCVQRVAREELDAHLLIGELPSKLAKRSLLGVVRRADEQLLSKSASAPSRSRLASRFVIRSSSSVRLSRYAVVPAGRAAQPYQRALALEDGPTRLQESTASAISLQPRRLRYPTHASMRRLVKVSWSAGRVSRLVVEDARHGSSADPNEEGSVRISKHR